MRRQHLEPLSAIDLEAIGDRWRLRRGARRRIWRRETEQGVSGLDQLAPVDVRLLDRFDALVCRLLHRDRWQGGIDAYHGDGLSVDFTCRLCGRSWFTYSFKQPERDRTSQPVESRGR